MNKIIAISILLFSASAMAETADMSNMDMTHMDMNLPSQEQAQQDTGVGSKQSATSKAQPNSTSPMDMSNMDHDSMDMSNMDHDSMDMSNMDHGSMDMGNMQGGKAPANARSPDYSQGRDYGDKAPPLMMGNMILASALFNQLEFTHNSDDDSGNYDFDGWLGSDWNRLVLKAEGEITDGNLQDARTELLWRKPVDIFWNTELGIRQDSGYEKNRTWLAFGVNGISPYWVDLDATLYVGENSRTALRAEATYDWRLLQRLVLQPSIEANLYSKIDLENNIGKGLSDVQAGLRLRYEVTRQFTPYIGVETTRQFGKTADLFKQVGDKIQNTQAIVGLRFWF